MKKLLILGILAVVTLVTGCQSLGTSAEVQHTSVAMPTYPQTTTPSQTAIVIGTTEVTDAMPMYSVADVEYVLFLWGNIVPFAPHTYLDSIDFSVRLSLGLGAYWEQEGVLSGDAFIAATDDPTVMEALETLELIKDGKVTFTVESGKTTITVPNVSPRAQTLSLDDFVAEIVAERQRLTDWEQSKLVLLPQESQDSYWVAKESGDSRDWARFNRAVLKYNRETNDQIRLWELDTLPNLPVGIQDAYSIASASGDWSVLQGILEEATDA